MDNQSLELRISDLESRLENLERRFVDALRMDAMSLAELELKVERLEARLKDLDHLKHIAFAAYDKVCPYDKARLEDIDDAVRRIASTYPFDRLSKITKTDRNPEPEQVRMGATPAFPVR